MRIISSNLLVPLYIREHHASQIGSRAFPRSHSQLGSYRQQGGRQEFFFSIWSRVCSLENVFRESSPCWQPPLAPYTPRSLCRLQQRTSLAAPGTPEAHCPTDLGFFKFYFQSTEQPHPGRNQSGGRSLAHCSQPLVVGLQ